MVVNIRNIQLPPPFSYTTLTLVLIASLGFLTGELFCRILTWDNAPSLNSLKPGPPPPIFSSCFLFPPPNPTPLMTLQATETAWPWSRVEQEMERLSSDDPNQGHKRMLYVVTPTVRGPSQIPDLVRTAQALYPMRKLIRWLIFEDSNRNNNTIKFPNQLTFLLDQLKDFTDEMEVHINWSRMTEKNELFIIDPKGVEARRDGMEWVRNRSSSENRGRRRWGDMLFFGDDDNTYDSDLFRQVLTLTNRRISAWPVGLVTPTTRLTSPVINSNGLTVHIHDGWKANRKFPMDFGGFAISCKLIAKKVNATIPYIGGYEESVLLNDLGIRLEEIQALANGATEVLSYHTRTTYVPFKRNISGKYVEDYWMNITSKNSPHQLTNCRTNIEDLYETYALARSFRKDYYY